MVLKGRLYGFTLAEVICALGVLGLTILVLLGLLTGSFATNDKSEEDFTSISVAKRVMNDLKSRPYAELADLVMHPPLPLKTVVDGRDYNCITKVKARSGPIPNLRLLELTVRLEWLESTTLGAGGSKIERPAFLELQSIVSPGGVL